MHGIANRVTTFSLKQTGYSTERIFLSPKYFKMFLLFLEMLNFEKYCFRQFNLIKILLKFEASGAICYSAKSVNVCKFWGFPIAAATHVLSEKLRHASSENFQWRKWAEIVSNKLETEFSAYNWFNVYIWDNKTSQRHLWTSNTLNHRLVYMYFIMEMCCPYLEVTL